MFSIGGGGSSPSFTYKLVITSLAIMILMPVFVTLYISNGEMDSDYREEIDKSLEDYYNFTGQTVSNKTCVWALTGIYTPFGVNTSGQASTSAYGYTPDGWLYGARIPSYSPTQYNGQSEGTESATDPYSYTVTYNSASGNGIAGFYKYASDTSDGHKAGELYTAVSMSTTQKSSMFFTTQNKVETTEGFYYTYSGYRYAFQPLNATDILDQEGNVTPVTTTTTSCSLIWYQYYDGATSQGSNVGGSGIAGQLIVSGNDGGVSYLTAQNIIQAFDTHTSSASFPLTFNGGIKLTLTIRIDPIMIAKGYSVEQCYNNGHWAVMLTSKTTDASAYTSTDYSFSIYNIWDTFVALFTFNLGDYYNISSESGMIMSVILTVILYAGLLAIGLEHHIVLIIAGLVAIIQGIATAIINGFSLDLSSIVGLMSPDVINSVASIIGGII